MMSQQSQGSGSVKRKRGRPRKDDSPVQGDNIPIMPVLDVAPNDPAGDGMVGRMVSGFVDGQFDAGYLINVKVVDTDTHLRGVVFLPDRVVPITAANDVAPNVRMYTRRDIPIPIPIPIPIQNPHPQPCDFVPPSEQISKQAAEVKIDEPKFPDQVLPSELQSCTPITGENQSATVMLPLDDDLPMNKTGLALGETVPLQKILDSGQESQTVVFMEQLKHDKAVGQDEVKQGTDMEIDATKESETASAPLVDITPSIGNINQESQVENQALSSDLKPNVLVHNELKDLNNEDNKTALSAEPESMASEPVGFEMLMEKPKRENNQTPLFAAPESMSPEPIGINFNVDKQNSPKNDTQDTPSELADKTVMEDDTSYPVGETANITDGGSYSVPMTNLSVMLFEGEAVPSQPASLGNEGSALPRMIDTQICSSSGATNNGDSGMEDAIPATHLELSSGLNLSGSG